MSQVASNGPLSSAPVPHDVSAPLPVKPLDPTEHMDNPALSTDSLAANAASAAAPVGTKRAVVTNPGGPREGELKRHRSDDLTTDRDHATSPSLLHETQAMEQDDAPPPVQAAAANNVTLANNGVMGIKPSPAGSPRNVSILPPRPVRPSSLGAEPGLDKASLSDPLMNLQVRRSPTREAVDRAGVRGRVLSPHIASIYYYILRLGIFCLGVSFIRILSAAFISLCPPHSLDRPPVYIIITSVPPPHSPSIPLPL